MTQPISTRPLASPDPVSAALLDHDRLMTVKLMETFGAVMAEQVAWHDDGRIIQRRSVIRHAGTGLRILDARLVIVKALVPEALVTELTTTTQLFGALLMKYGVEVAFSNRSIFATNAEQDGAARRWGRRQTMTLADTGELICEVEELLVDAVQLSRLGAVAA